MGSIQGGADLIEEVIIGGDKETLAMKGLYEEVGRKGDLP